MGIRKRRFVLSRDNPSLRFKTPAGSSLSQTIITAARYLFSYSGQSNMSGSGGKPTLTVNPPSTDLYRIERGTYDLSFLSESVNEGETPVTQMASSVQQQMGYNSINHNASQGGTAIASFVSGQVLFTNIINGMRNAITYAAGSGMPSATLHPGGLFWIQGTTDDANGTDIQTYRDRLDSIQRSYETEARKYLQQPTASVPLYYLQTTDFPQVSIFTSSVVVAQEQLSALSGSKCILIGPAYTLLHTGSSTNSDFHYTASAHRRNGEMFAKVFQRVNTSGSWVPFRYNNITITGNVLYMTFTGGVGTASIDTLLNAEKPFYGFAYYDPLNTGSSPHIVSASLIGDQVVIQLTNTGTSSGRLRYGYYGIPGGQSGYSGWYSPGGNIRDNDNIIPLNSSTVGDVMSNSPLYNWLVAFDRQVNAYVSGGSSYTASIASGCVKSNGFGFLSAYNNSVLDGATSFVLAFKTRKQQEYPNGAYLFSRFRSATNRQFAVQHAGNNDMKMFLSSGSNSNSEWIKTPGNIISAGQIYAHVIVFSGSGGDNPNRLSWWISNGSTGSFAPISCTYGGTIAAQVPSGVAADLCLFGLSAPDFDNQRISGTLGELAVWRNRSASLAQINEIFPNGGLGGMTNFNVSSTTMGLPDTWYRFQGDYRDSGKRGDHLYPYYIGSSTSSVIFSASLNADAVVYEPLDSGSNWSVYTNRLYNQVLTASSAMTGTGFGLPLGGVSGSMSFSFWLNASSSNGPGQTNWGTAAGSGEAIFRLADLSVAAGSRQNSFSFNMRPGVNTQAFWTFATGASDLNVNRLNLLSLPVSEVWHHFLLSWSSSGSAGTGTVAAFINGVPVPQSINGYIPSTLLTSSHFFTLAGNNKGSGATNGSFAYANFGVYNGFLSSSHAVAHYNSGVPINLLNATGNASLIHYWDIGSGLTNNYSTFPIVRDLVSGVVGITPMPLTLNTNMGLSNFTSSFPGTGSVQIPGY